MSVSNSPQKFCLDKLASLKQINRNINKDKKIKIDSSKSQYPLLKTVALIQLGWKLWGRQDQKDDANLIWIDTYVTEQLVKRLKPYQRVNHFPNSQQLGKKNLLSLNLKDMAKTFPLQYQFYPSTWILPENSSELNMYIRNKPDCYYIVKPVGSSQGRGIFLTKQIQDIKDNMVVQQYIEKPYLLDNCKFDMRIYVLIKSLFPLKIYIYKEGLARLAIHPYKQPNQSNFENYHMHLTNYAINKTHPLYQQNKDQMMDNIGHKRSYSSIINFLQKQGHDTQTLQQKIDMIIIKTILSVYSKLSQSYKNSRNPKQDGDSVCFQILGFDIILTDKLEPKLLEVNHSPSFHADSPLDFILKKSLLLDTMNLLGLDSENKLSYIKKKAQQTYRDSWIRTAQKLIHKNISQESEQYRMGGYRKIYPIEDCNILNATQKYLITNIINKLNEKLYPSLKNRRFMNRSFGEADKNKEYHRFLISIQRAPIVEKSREKKGQYFFYTFNNAMRQRFQKSIDREQTVNDEETIIKRHVCAEKDQKRTNFPMKINNLELAKEARPHNLETLDYNNKLIRHHKNLYKLANNKTIQQNNGLEIKNLAQSKLQFFKEQNKNFESELHYRINKMKAARNKINSVLKSDRKNNFDYSQTSKLTQLKQINLA